MKIYAPTDDFVGFLNVLATKKRAFDHWRYLQVSLDRDEKQNLPIEEILQFLGFHFQKAEPLVFKIPSANQLFVLMTKDEILAVNKFEKGILEQFATIQIHTEVRALDQNGLDHFAKQIRTQINPANPVQRTLMTRLSRMGNRIMVLDQNPTITRQMEKILSGFGYVVTLNHPENFLEQYIEYAPDVLFLETDSRTVHGNETLRNLVGRVDPYAHVVMISDKPTQKSVLESKQNGAKGFIVKPVNPDILLQHMARVPTFCLRGAKG